MANISASIMQGQGGKQYKWSGVTENDTPLTVNVDSGLYTLTIEGSYGGMSIEMLYGKSAGNEASVDADNLTFTENKSENIAIGQGFCLPSLTGGSSASVDIYLSPIANR